MIGKELEDIYLKYNKRDFVHPDPLEFLYNYQDLKDRELVGLIASSLAYGRVGQILKSVSHILGKMGPQPYDFLKRQSSEDLISMFRDFKHRFTNGSELSAFLNNIKAVLEKYDSLNDCFLSHHTSSGSMVESIYNFTARLRLGECDLRNSLIPMPYGNCAYKRINLYLRWMVRKDSVDPGGWKGVKTSDLLVPLDVHMHRVALKYGLTKRKSADINTVKEITRSFARFSPDDPVKYDFALTRAGIRKTGSY